jgi:hypothetical protein
LYFEFELLREHLIAHNSIAVLSHSFPAYLGEMDESEPKRRRIVIEEDDIDEEVISNPDELVDDNDNEDDIEGEDLAENWLE